MKTVTITRDVDDDPYSAMWTLRSADETAAVERYFSAACGWVTASAPDLRRATLLAELDIDDARVLRWMTDDAEVCDKGADGIETLLGRGPDSLS